MVAQRFGLTLILVIATLCGGCDGDDACDEVAAQLRVCCEKGPAELRSGCANEVEKLEQDGDTDACETSLSSGEFEPCGE